MDVPLAAEDEAVAEAPQPEKRKFQVTKNCTQCRCAAGLLQFWRVLPSLLVAEQQMHLLLQVSFGGMKKHKKEKKHKREHDRR